MYLLLFLKPYYIYIYLFIYLFDMFGPLHTNWDDAGHFGSHQSWQTECKTNCDIHPKLDSLM